MTHDSHSSAPVDLPHILKRSQEAAIALGGVRAADRNHALHAVAQVIDDRQDDILEANTLDLEASREMAVPDLILDWLKLTPERLQTAVKILHRLGELSDPVQQRVMSTSYQLDNCQTYGQLVPLGVIAMIYEALPELGAIAAGMCIKTGNSLILRGGSEASHSNAAIAQAIQLALDDIGLPDGCLQLLDPDHGASIREVVTQDQFINLIIPYGRPSLVQQVVRQATAPVLQSAMGNCYLYWSPSGSLDLVRHLILDSHQSEPDPVNAIEKVLIHRNQNSAALNTLWNNLQEKGFQLRGDAALVAEYPELMLAEANEWRQAYLNKIVAFKSVESLEEAIAWINHNSSGHADCLVTESYQESRQFSAGVNSASVYINSSPRFSRNPRRISAICLGMSNQKGHRRGSIGLETLTTVKHVIQGNSWI